MDTVKETPSSAATIGDHPEKRKAMCLTSQSHVCLGLPWHDSLWHPFFCIIFLLQFFTIRGWSGIVAFPGAAPVLPSNENFRGAFSFKTDKASRQEKQVCSKMAGSFVCFSFADLPFLL